MNINLKKTIGLLSVFIIMEILIKTFDLNHSGYSLIFNLISTIFIVYSYINWTKYNEFTRGTSKFDSRELLIINSSFFFFILFVKFFVYRDFLF